eukprot:1179871-Prorocentrum_minimum.AAC.2
MSWVSRCASRWMMSRRLCRPSGATPALTLGQSHWPSRWLPSCSPFVCVFLIESSHGAALVEACSVHVACIDVTDANANVLSVNVDVTDTNVDIMSVKMDVTDTNVDIISVNVDGMDTSLDIMSVSVDVMDVNVDVTKRPCKCLGINADVILCEATHCVNTMDVLYHVTPAHHRRAHLLTEHCYIVPVILGAHHAPARIQVRTRRAYICRIHFAHQVYSD